MEEGLAIDISAAGAVSVETNSVLLANCSQRLSSKIKLPDQTLICRPATWEGTIEWCKLG